MKTSDFDPLTWLAQWYAQQCDEDWEHSFGVKIETLDNPGWLIKIDLSDTDLSGKLCEDVAVGMDVSDGNPDLHWHHCKVERDHFIGACGVHDLPVVIGIFRQFAESSEEK